MLNEEEPTKQDLDTIIVAVEKATKETQTLITLGKMANRQEIIRYFLANLVGIVNL